MVHEPNDPATRTAHFAARALNIQPTGIRKMFDLAGEDTIHFGLGEPDFQPPDVAIEAFYQAMKDGHNKYTTQAGLPVLREAIADQWSDFVPGLGAGNVCVTMSGTNALLVMNMTLLDPGDVILVPDPGFPLYVPHAGLMGAEARTYACRHEHGFVPQVEELEALVDDRTRAILYNFPGNPTGATIDEAQRDALLEFAMRHDLWIISDEVYDKVVYNGHHVSFLTEQYDKVILVNSFSKTFAMTGWRIGYLLSPHLGAMEQLSKLQYYVTACSNEAMQYAVLAALRHAPDYPREMAQAFRKRRDVIVERLDAMPGVDCHRPRAAFYAFPRVQVPGLDSETIAMEILRDGVLCSPGTAFGPAGEGHLRFAFTNGLDVMKRGLDLVEGTLNRLHSESAARGAPAAD